MKLSFHRILAALAPVAIAATGCALDDADAPFGEPELVEYRQSGDAPILRIFELTPDWDPFDEHDLFTDMQQLHEHLIDQAQGSIQLENQINDIEQLFDDDNWAERAEAMAEAWAEAGYWFQTEIDSQITSAQLSMVFDYNPAGGIVPCVINMNEGHVPIAEHNLSIRIVDSSEDGSTLVLNDVGSSRLCGASDGFYFSDWEDGAPTKVNLCPTSCDSLESAIDSDLDVGIDVFIEE